MVKDGSYETKVGFLSAKIIDHIESHSDQLANGIWKRLEKSARLGEFREKVPPEELWQRVYEIYRNLGDWLQTRSERDIEKRYLVIGNRRASQGVPASQLVLAILATKEHLWEHITQELLAEDPAELMQVLELSRAIEMFFDRAVHFAVLGHERYAQRKAFV